MQDIGKVPRRPEGKPPERRPLVDEQLADQLLGKAQAEGVELLGPDGLFAGDQGGAGAGAGGGNDRPPGL